MRPASAIVSAAGVHIEATGYDPIRPSAPCHPPYTGIAWLALWEVFALSAGVNAVELAVGGALTRFPRPNRCHPVMEDGMANRDTTASSGEKPSPVARSSNGTPLFECLCPDCGIV